MPTKKHQGTRGEKAQMLTEGKNYLRYNLPKGLRANEVR